MLWNPVKPHISIRIQFYIQEIYTFKKKRSFSTIVNNKPSLTIVNVDPALTIVNDDPSFKKQSYKKRSFIAFFKNDRYSFSKSLKREGRFQKRNDRFWKRLNTESKNDRLTIVFKNDLQPYTCKCTMNVYSLFSLDFNMNS